MFKKKKVILKKYYNLDTLALELIYSFKRWAKIVKKYVSA